MLFKHQDDPSFMFPRKEHNESLRLWKNYAQTDIYTKPTNAGSVVNPRGRERLSMGGVGTNCRGEKGRMTHFAKTVMPKGA